MSNRDYDRERSGEAERDRWRSGRRPQRDQGYGGETEYGREGWTGFGAEGDWEGGRGREGGYATYGRETGTGQRGDWRRGGSPGRGSDFGQEERSRRGGYEGGYERGYGGYGGFGGTGGRGEEYGRGEEEYGRRFGQFQEHPEWGHYGGRGYWQDYGWGSQWPHGRSHEGYGWQGQQSAQGRGPGAGTFGQHAGRGPRGYQRSDDRIREDINDRLTEHGEIDATDIEVHVQNGEVSLRGSVDNRYMKRIAEDLTDTIPGVKDVHNEIRVRQRTTHEEERHAA